MADFDIYENKKYKWTQATTEDIKEAGVPFVQMTEYENHTDLLFQNIMFQRRSVVNPAAGAGMTSFSDLYKGTYQIYPAGNTYKFPYLGKQPMHMETGYKQIDIDSDVDSWGHSIEQLKANWKQYITTDYKNYTDQLLKAIAPGSFFDKMDTNFVSAYNDFTNGAPWRIGSSAAKQSPKVYESSNTGQFSTTFNLINETDAFTQEHYKFIIRMMMSLAPSYPDPMRVHVPYVYSVSIPSLTELPLAFISSFDAAPIGSAKMMGSIYVPEGWKISIAFNSLFPVSKQLLSLLGNKNIGDLIKNTFELPDESIQQLTGKDNPIDAGKFSTATERAISDINSNYQLGGE